jgi:hypothetical protein
VKAGQPACLKSITGEDMPQYLVAKKVFAIAIKSFALVVVLGTAYQAMAQDATTPYPNMAPINQ